MLRQPFVELFDRLDQIDQLDEQIHAFITVTPELALQQAEAAEATAKLAVIEHERLKPLVEKGVVSTDAFDKAATQVETTAATQRSADFQVEVRQQGTAHRRLVHALKYRAVVAAAARRTIAARGLDRTRVHRARAGEAPEGSACSGREPVRPRHRYGDV